MSNKLPVVYIARHGETAWSLSGQHTGLTDLPLTPRGEEHARRLGTRLAGLKFGAVFTSPLQRASRTCELAGFSDVAISDPDLREWNYGQYEGLRRDEIREKRPDWEIFRDGCPGGESVCDVAARADAVIARLLKEFDGGVEEALLFSSGHLLRVLAARWVGADPTLGRNLILGTTSVSLLGFEHSRKEAVIRLWNDTSHLE